MRGIILFVLACALAVGGVTAMPGAMAAPRVGEKKARKSRPDADKAYSLDDIMKSPKEYEGREVFFYCRYATTSNLFKNVNTQFNATQHANFAVWPDKTVLWDVKGRKNVLPTLYIAKKDGELLEALRTTEKYELVAVTGLVMNVYAGYPWILVTKFERAQTPADKLCEPVVEHMQNGHDALSANSGGVAARHFEQALQYGLPPEYRAKAYEQLAQAYLLDNQLDKAQSYLRQAVETDPTDAILNLALADVALRMEDPGEALAHCQFALERSGRLPQVYGIMGEAKSLTGDYVKAFTDLNAAAGTPGISVREKAMVNVRRARIYTRAGRHPDAARVYAASSEPGEALAGEAWLHNEVGLFYEMLYLETADARYLDSAYMAYEEAARLNRLDAGYLYNMTEVEFRRQRLAPYPDFTLAKELIERINQVEPEYTPARILEGRVLFAEDKANEAEFRYQSVSGQIGSDSQALLALAEAYMDLGRYLDAGTAVRRARRLQPWNLRVQALGKHLEKMSEAAEIAKAEAYRNVWPLDESTLGEPWQREEFDRYIERREVWRPRPLPQWPQNDYRSMQEEVCPEGMYGWSARGARNQNPELRRGEMSHNPYRRPGYTPGAAPASAQMDGRKVRVRPGEGIRVDQEGRARTESRPYPPEIQASASPAPAPGRPEKPYPRTEVKLPGHAPAERKSLRPDAETSGRPAPLDLGYNAGDEGARDNRRFEEHSDADLVYPVENPEPREGDYREEYRDERRADVREEYRDDYRDDRGGYRETYREEYPAERRDVRESDRRAVRPDREYRDDYGRADEREYRRPEPRSREPEYRDEYSRDARDYRDNRGRDYRAPNARDARDARDGYGRDYDDRDYGRGEERGYGREQERGRYRDDRNGYGQIPGVDEAYASLPAWDYEDAADGASLTPMAFSFSPDESPVLIAEMQAPAASERDMPVRNANVYRKNSGSRRPAEIIERDTIRPGRDDDHSAMVPPADGAMRRAEVRLPSSSRGLGMASDFDRD